MELREKESDILVVGAGPTGLIAALTLKKAGHKVCLIGPKVEGKNNITTALMLPSLEIFNDISLLESVSKKATPLKALQIIDSTERLFYTPPLLFRAEEIQRPYFALNISNRDLNALLISEAEKKIPWIQTTVDEWYIEPNFILVKTQKGLFKASLAIGADGKSSQARQAAGIFMKQTFCKQVALALCFNHTRAHNNISTEFHTKTGPFTQIPLQGNSSALLWITSPEKADDLNVLDKDIFSALIEEKMQSMLGKVSIQNERSLYPLFKGIANRCAQNRIALIGEAAHIMPPIGAQGLNLGIRDIKDLVACLSTQYKDFGGKESLQHYNAKRQRDIFLCTHFVNLLNNSLLSEKIPLQIARTVGSTLLKKIPSFRNFIAQEILEPRQNFLEADVWNPFSCWPYKIKQQEKKKLTSLF